MLTDPFFQTAQALVIDGNASMRRAVLAQRKRSANPHPCVAAGGVLKVAYAGSAATTVAGSAMTLACRQLCGNNCARSRFFSVGRRSKTSLR